MIIPKDDHSKHSKVLHDKYNTKCCLITTNVNEKKRSERRKHCALAAVRQSQEFSLRRRPIPGAQDGQNLIS